MAHLRRHGCARSAGTLRLGTLALALTPTLALTRCALSWHPEAGLVLGSRASELLHVPLQVRARVRVRVRVSG